MKQLCCMALAMMLPTMAAAEASEEPMPENPYFPPGLSDEEYERIYQEQVLPIMERMMESIAETTSSEMFQPLVIVVDRKIFANELFQKDVSKHWDKVMKPLMDEYIVRHKISVEVDRAAVPTADEVIRDTEAMIDEQIATYEAMMDNPNYDNAEMLGITQDLDRLIGTKASIKEMTENLSERDREIVSSVIVQQRINSAKYDAFFEHIASRFGGTPIQTQHGLLSPKALAAFIREQEDAGKIIFNKPDYRQRWMDYVASLSPTNK